MRNGDPHYFQYNVKEYEHWTLRIEEKQRYLGQAVIWLEREGDMQRLSSLSAPERDELWGKVLPEYEAAMANLWHPDHMNYSWLGNFFGMHSGHGHMHMIPRYASKREFAGEVFEDLQWGKHYKPYPTALRSESVVFAVRDALRAEIPGALSI